MNQNRVEIGKLIADSEKKLDASITSLKHVTEAHRSAVSTLNRMYETSCGGDSRLAVFNYRDFVAKYAIGDLPPSLQADLYAELIKAYYKQPDVYNLVQGEFENMVRIIEANKTITTCEQSYYAIAFTYLAFGNNAKSREKATLYIKNAIDSGVSPRTLSYGFSLLLVSDIMDNTLNGKDLVDRYHERLDNILAIRPIGFDLLSDRINEYDNYPIVAAHKNASANYTARKKILLDTISRRPEKAEDRQSDTGIVAEYFTKDMQLKSVPVKQNLRAQMGPVTVIEYPKPMTAKP